MDSGHLAVVPIHSYDTESKCVNIQSSIIFIFVTTQ